MNRFLRELTVYFERILAGRGFGISTLKSLQDETRERTTLTIARDGNPIWSYRFEYREIVEDESEWIENLAEQMASENLTAIFAVTRHVFSEGAERAATHAFVCLHEVDPEILNQIFVVWPTQGLSILGPPLIVTQRLKAGPSSPRWIRRATVSDGNEPLGELSLEAEREPDGQVRLAIKQGSAHLTTSGLELDVVRSPEGLEKCYARTLGGCDVLSGEHIISKSVLKFIPGDIIVGVAPGLPDGRSYKTSINNLKWSVLCARHNSLLTEVDKDGAAFFSILNDAVSGRVPSVGTRTSFGGGRFERWLLKVACGTSEIESRRGFVTPAPVEWVQILFGERPWPPYFGSFWSQREGSRSHENGFEVITSVDSVNGRPKGITFNGLRLSVILALGSFQGVPGMRRPARVAAGLDDFSVDVELIWH